MLSSHGHKIVNVKFGTDGGLILVTTQGIEYIKPKALMELPTTQYNDLMLMLEHT